MTRRSRLDQAMHIAVAEARWAADETQRGVAEAQRTALAEGMAPRRVSVCEDETFHPGIGWVAIEPVSNFVRTSFTANPR